MHCNPGESGQLYGPFPASNLLSNSMQSLQHVGLKYPISMLEKPHLQSVAHGVCGLIYLVAFRLAALLTLGYNCYILPNCHSVFLLDQHLLELAWLSSCIPDVYRDLVSLNLQDNVISPHCLACYDIQIAVR